MSAKSERPPYATKTFRLIDEDVRKRAMYLLQHAPTDRARPIEIVLREHKTQRSLDQNNLYYALLTDIADQAWIEGRQYSVEVLHEYMKRSLLPEDKEAVPEDVREGYVKWSFDPAGERLLVGSTTMLTVRGMNSYITGVEAFGANLGVVFHAQVPR